MLTSSRNANARTILYPDSNEDDMKSGVLALVDPNGASTSSNVMDSENDLGSSSRAVPSTTGESPNRNQEPPTASPPPPPPPPTPRQDWKKVQREREKRERDERERIKALIRHDHSERRHAEELRKMSTGSQKQPAVSPAPPAQAPPTRIKSSEIRVQVRTFDGGSLRSSFSRYATIAGQIRPWIDSVAESDMPYTLKLILTPMPNRTIEAAEEDVALADLEITASCTLVMVPVRHFTESYGPSVSGTIGSAVTGTFGYLTGSIYSLASGIGTVIGYPAQPPTQPSTGIDEGDPKRSERHSIRVRTLADQRQESRSNDQQFYNGNQLNFQPRKDNEEGKDS